MNTRHTAILILALRNLRRYLRRTTLAATAMIIGGMLLMFSLSLGDGTHEEWIESGVRMGTGHVTVEAPAFRASPTIDNRLSASARAAAEQALLVPGVADAVTAVSAKLVVSGLASSASGARPAQIMGVDPAAEVAFSTLDEQVVEGRYLEPGDRLAAFVGVGLAESLDVRLDSRFVLTAQGVDREIAGQLVRVVGIFRSGVPEIDQALVHIPLSTVGEWLGSGQDVTNIGVLVGDSAAVPGLGQALAGALAEPIAAQSATVMDWREAMPQLAAAVAIDDFGNYLVHGILFTLIGFGVVNTVLMSVLYRHREFGVLQALGLTPRETGAVVLVEGLVLTVVSGIAGICLGILVTSWIWGDGLDYSAFYSGEMTFSGVVLDPVIIPLFRVSRIVQVLLFMLFVGTVASVYPAYRAATIDVTEAMKFER